MKIINLITTLTLMATISSCSVLNSNKKKDNTISGGEATRVETTTPQPGKQETTPAGNQAQTTPDKTAQAKTISDFDCRIGGEWTIIQVGKISIDRDENMPYVIFEPSKHQFYASNGCNTLNGSYTVDSLQQISFHNVLSTLRACPDVEYENAINALISENPVRIKFSEIGSESFIDFLNKEGQSAMRMRRGNLEYLNGQWDVESISGLKKLDTPASIFFDITELKLHGNTGCNIVNGDIYLDHRRPNSVDFSNMMTTRMACPYETQQTAMLVALEECAYAINDGTDKVILLNSEGKILMTLKKADHVYED